MKEKSLVPSIADVFFLASFLCLSFSLGYKMLWDGDTGYHIRIGDLMLEQRAILKHDAFLHHTPEMPFPPHEWLAQILMALIHRLAGLTGIVVFFAFLVSLCSCLMFRNLRAGNGNILLAALVAILATASTQIHWLARPHILSLVFLLIWYDILDAYQYRNRNRLGFLPPLMLLWINLHGGAFGGLMLLGVYIAGNLVHSDREKARSLAATMAFCLLASMANPQGYRVLVIPFRLVSNEYVMEHLQEFLSPNFHGPLAFKYMLLFMIAVFAWSRERLNAIELALTVIFTTMALEAARFIPLFAVVTAPIILRRAGAILNASDGKIASCLKSRSSRIAAIDAAARTGIWPAAAVLLVMCMVVSGKVKFEFDPKLKPVDAVEFIKREHIPGNMFNDDEYGDYIIYAARREYKVFIYGGIDMYGLESMLKEYFKVAGFEPGWEDVFEKYGIGWVLCNTKSLLARYLRARKEWHPVYADRVTSIFVKNSSEYRDLIAAYPDVKPPAPEEMDDGNLTK